MTNLLTIDPIEALSDIALSDESELRELIERLGFEVIDPATVAPAPSIETSSKIEAAPTGKPLSAADIAIINRHHDEADKSGDRSKHEFKLVRKLIKRGCDRESVWARVRNRGKFAERGRTYFDRTWGKATARINEKRREGDLVPLGKRDPATGKIVLSAKRIMPTARAFVRRFYWHEERAKLLTYCGMHMGWNGSCYREVEEDVLRQRLYRWLPKCLRYVTRRGGPVLEPFEENSATVNDAIKAIKAHVLIASSTPTRSWLGAVDGPPANELIACKSVLYHLPTGNRLPTTPRFFATSALDFDPDDALSPPVEWLKFLDSIFGGDEESRDMLQEWFGYVVSGDTRQQKALLIVGPTRAGKGLIADALTGIVGAANMVGTSTSKLATQFGLSSLIGKSLVVIGDARFNDRNIQTVNERLLTIIGNGDIEVERKYYEAVNVRLGVRFVFLSNELPRFEDASGALAGRFLVLQLKHSFLGKEDTGLAARLVPERAAIFNWAITGYRRLQARGHFVQPKSSRNSLQHLRDLSSPVLAFVRDKCLVDPEHRVSVSELFEKWNDYREWSDLSEFLPRQQFGQQLAAVVPGLARRRTTGNQAYYAGVMLAPEVAGGET